MRIAQLAPLYEKRAAEILRGKERVVSYLTEELVRQGHEVMLFASGDSETKARLVAACRRSLRLDKRYQGQMAHHFVMLERVLQRAAEFDIIHFHVDYLHFPLSRREAVTHVTTLHGRLDIPDLVPLYQEFREMPVISISNGQREPLPWANWQATVYHGLPADMYRFRPEPGSYLAFLGRISPEKRVDRAIEIAKQVGIPLKIAAKIDRVDKDYFDSEMAPLLHNSLVEFVGEIGDGEKDEFLGNAYALLFPIDWPEPFALVMIEAMACGTPVIAYRGGAVPEVMDHGHTGFVVEGLEDAVEAVRRVPELSRKRCREVFDRRFTATRMAHDYVRQFERLIARNQEVFGGGVMAKGEVIRIRNEFYIRSSSARVDVRTRVLKQGDMFAVFDRFGDVETFGSGELGLYYQDTRFLSRLTLKLGKDRPLLLSSTVREDNAVLAVDATNTDVWRDSEIVVPRGTIHVFRSKILWDKTCHERLRIHNYGRAAVDLVLSIEFDADFADIFELRGMHRERHGRRLEPEIMDDGLVLAYEGLDQRFRRTRIMFNPTPSRVSKSVVSCQVHLEPGKNANYQWAIACEVDDNSRGETKSYEKIMQEATRALERTRAREPQIFADNEQFNDWLNRSLADLHMMRTETRYGPYPYAGVPWFSTVFGRDGIITALQCLWFDPSIARGVLAYLAANQADSEKPEQDAQPGKVLHEFRDDEMAVLGEVPFRHYYGSIDATPLFVMLAGAYYKRTGDRAFMESIWSNVQRALEWIDHYGDADGDGFVEYSRRSKHGLIHQGWKDSHDSVFHSDGVLAEAPIALCEVQSYVYAAKLAASEMAVLLGDGTAARELKNQAKSFRRRFEEVFWCEELSTYVLALDGSKRPCRVRTSNAGHCLFAGIATAEHARRVATTLTDETSFSGWGIRTVASSEARYNPMSYHNGSIWPHDNSLIAAGFARYELKGSAAMVLAGLMDASIFFDLHRLPELFCGFPRRPGESPTLYPVACAPQAWASAAVFLLLQACLGLDVFAPERRLVFSKPFLPQFLPQVSIRDLKVGDASVDLLLTRHDEGDVGVNVLRRTGILDVVVLK